MHRLRRVASIGSAIASRRLFSDFGALRFMNMAIYEIVDGKNCRLARLSQFRTCKEATGPLMRQDQING
jgi:hypothetical protein